MATTRIHLVTGEQLLVDGGVEEVAKALEDAMRSSAGTLAWLTDSGRGEAFGINAAHVVTVRPAES